MTSGVDSQDRFVLQCRSNPAAYRGQFGQRRQDVEFCDRHRDFLKGRQVTVRVASKFLKEQLFSGGGFFVGGQDFFFVFLQFGRDETLAVFQRLLANEGFRDFVSVGVGHFEVVTENFVVTDLQVVDAGFVHLPLLISGDPFFAAAGQQSKLIEFFVVPFTNEVSVRCRKRTFVSERRFESSSQFRTEVQVGFDEAEPFARTVGDTSLEFGKTGECRGHLLQIAWAGSSGRDPCQKSRQVERLFQCRADVGTDRHVIKKFGDRVEPRVDRVGIDQRRRDPIGQQSRTHRRAGVIDHAQQGAFTRSGPQRAGDFEAAAGRSVDLHDAGAVMCCDAAEMIQVAALRFL